MKKKMLAFLLALYICYGILFPKLFAAAAANGLYLWYHSVLPSLLPFSILSGIVIHTEIYDTVFDKICPILGRIYPLRAPLFFPLIAGFLFGFPLGSKLCADLYHVGKISKEEAIIVSCISNNFGPAFLYNYVFASLPEHQMPGWLFLLLCYLPPLLLGRILIFTVHSNVPEKCSEKMPASRFEIKLTIIDDGIMNGFTTMIKLAGYIMFFSIAADIMQHIPFLHPAVSCCFTGFLEITNGIHAITCTNLPPTGQYLFATAFVSFGGLSGIFQTASMLSELKSGMRTYVKFRMYNTFATVLLTAALVCCQFHR
ncbi:hypothetical protein [uncultured Eubacterium sp.]|uniref:hypothetical protein n=1 Tax=uncultured Eubacterium sp. TaxID=165185 RepID=UPI0025CED586|nr:hypothetical protein [uncultured Eubacterium sp.]